MATAPDIQQHSAHLKRHVSSVSSSRGQFGGWTMVGIAIAVSLGSLSLVNLRAADLRKAPSQQNSQAPAEWTNDLSPITPSDWNYDRAAHLLERAGFGGTPEEIEKLAAMTPAEAVNYLVDYESIDDSRLPAYEPSNTYPHGYRHSRTPGLGGGRERPERPTASKLREKENCRFSRPSPSGSRYGSPRCTRWTAAASGGPSGCSLTPRPLEEKLTLFWHNHFATSQEKIRRYEHMLNQNQTLRTHAAGNFRDMLVAVAQDPAMLNWLDNSANVKGKPNENFAREVMELFTMGEGQGYTESDIREIARAFTGWTMTPDPTVDITAKFRQQPQAARRRREELPGGERQFRRLRRHRHHSEARGDAAIHFGQALPLLRPRRGGAGSPGAVGQDASSRRNTSSSRC